MGKQVRLNFRSNDEFKARLKGAAERIGLDQSVLGTAALEAVVKHIEENGSITIPIQIIGPKKSEPGSPLEEHSRAHPPGSIASPDAVILNDSGKKSGPHARSTKPGVAKTLGREKSK